jgi:hypothetical protein
MKENEGKKHIFCARNKVVSSLPDIPINLVKVGSSFHFISDLYTLAFPMWGNGTPTLFSFKQTTKY